MVRAKPQYPPSRAAVLPLVGGELAFDLTNTSSGRGGPHWLEHLQTAAHVVDWARHAKVLTARDAGALHRLLAADHRLAAALLGKMLKLRELIHAIGVAIAATAKAQRADMDALVRLHAECLAHARLVPTGATFAWVWNPAASPVEAVLGPIALSALSVLTGADLTRIKRCPGDHCGWLFFDATKNKGRRWCEMEVCGNRAKQKRRRRLQRAATGE
jgi:predicted RNA-binding Zn ribbon-like protein